MKRLEKLYNTVINNGMDFGTGTWSAISPKIKNKLNDYGEFEAHINPNDLNSFTEEEIDKLEAVTIGWKGTKTIDEVASSLFSKNNQIKYSSSLGYYLDLFAGYVQEGDYRKNATSGGFGTWILKELLDKKLVDKVIHVKECPGEEILFKYVISDSIDDIKNGAKTRYYPVELSDVLEYIKNNDGKYALVGVPSFIYGIRLLSEQEKIFKERIVYTVGLICGHQKSTHYLKSLIDQVGIEYDSLCGVDFRKKVEDENADEYIIEFRYMENRQEKTLTKKMRDLVGYSWGQGHFKIKASDFTDDVMNETADVTLGDAWIPPYKFDSRGNNVLIVRNEMIYKLILEAAEEGRISIDRLSEKEAYASQPGHFRHTVDELPYRIQKMKKHHQWVPETRIDENKHIPFLRRKVQDVREEIRDSSRSTYVNFSSKEDFGKYILKMKKLEKKYNAVYSLIEMKRLGFTKSLKKAKDRFF